MATRACPDAPRLPVLEGRGDGGMRGGEEAERPQALRASKGAEGVGDIGSPFRKMPTSSTYMCEEDEDSLSDSSNKAEEEDEEDLEEESGQEEVEEETEEELADLRCELPAAPASSLGSLYHGAGACKPCAFHWKPGGCTRGRKCSHCHLCPEGELKARKRAKVSAIREAKRHSLQQCGLSPQEPLKVTLLSGSYADDLDDSSLAPPPGLSLPLGPPGLADRQQQGGHGASGLLSLAAVAGPPELASAGSAAHGTGLCRPCAWFWKPSGCANGKECYHCHLCPKGEVKSRKKARAAVQKKRPQESFCRGPESSVGQHLPVLFPTLLGFGDGPSGLAWTAGQRKVHGWPGEAA